jgi:hypothetical protein
MGEIMRNALAVMLIVGFAATAQAQSAEGVSVEAGVGAGYARSLHGDFFFGGTAISGTGRVRVSPHVAFEAQVGYWQHTDHQTFPTPGGDVATTDKDGFTSITVSVLGVADRDARIGPYGGGGVGLFYHSSLNEQSGSSSFPPTVSKRTRVGLGGQLVGGVDGRAASRLKVFGEFRFEVQSFEDPGSASYRVLGGVRVPIG